MTHLHTAPNLAQADRIYAAFLELHEDQTDAQSHAINAGLVFALINHIGDERVILEAFALARAAT